MKPIQLDKIIKENLSFPNIQNLKQRGIADKIEAICNSIIQKNIENVHLPRSRRSIEDISIGDNIYVDHKTTDVSLNFKMPNMISIDRLKKLDRDLIYNFIIYDSGAKKIIKNFSLYYWELNWEHLHIQNLGKGQLQIKDMKKFLDSPKSKISKDDWLKRLKEEAIMFYQKVQKDAIKREKEWNN